MLDSIFKAYEFTHIFKGIADTYAPGLEHGIVYRDPASSYRHITETTLGKMQRDHIGDTVPAALRRRKKLRPLYGNRFKERTVTVDNSCIYLLGVMRGNRNFWIPFADKAVIIPVITETQTELLGIGIADKVLHCGYILIEAFTCKQTAWKSVGGGHEFLCILEALIVDVIESPDIGYRHIRFLLTSAALAEVYGHFKSDTALLSLASEVPAKFFTGKLSRTHQRSVDCSELHLVVIAVIGVIKARNRYIIGYAYPLFEQTSHNTCRHCVVGADYYLRQFLRTWKESFHSVLSWRCSEITVVNAILTAGDAPFGKNFPESFKAVGTFWIVLRSRHITETCKAVNIDEMLSHTAHRLSVIDADMVHSLYIVIYTYGRDACLSYPSDDIFDRFRIVDRICKKHRAVIGGKIGKVENIHFSCVVTGSFEGSAKGNEGIKLQSALFGRLLHSFKHSTLIALVNTCYYHSDPVFIHWYPSKTSKIRNDPNNVIYIVQ